MHAIASPRIDVTDMLSLPYRRGGRDPLSGVDCLWAAIEVHRRLGLFDADGLCADESRASSWLLDSQWMELARDVGSFEASCAARLGDLCVFGEHERVHGVAAVVEVRPLRVLLAAGGRFRIAHPRVIAADSVLIVRWDGSRT